jgi:alpha-tubulin suppressor-like RCC1 family protein
LGVGDLITRNTPTLLQSDYITKISGGYYNSLILNNNGQVYSFGYNNYLQLGLGDYNIRNVPTLILNVNNINQISAGGFHCLLLNNNNKILSFGQNYVIFELNISIINWVLSMII